jgi:hypothetical protein
VVVNQSPDSVVINPRQILECLIVPRKSSSDKSIISRSD